MKEGKREKGRDRGRMELNEVREGGRKQERGVAWKVQEVEANVVRRRK